MDNPKEKTPLLEKSITKSGADSKYGCTTEERGEDSTPSQNVMMCNDHLAPPSARIRQLSSRRSRLISWASDPGSLLASKGYTNPIDYDIEDEDEVEIKVEKVTLKRNLTLFHAVVFIIVNVTGTGIFITPTGVTQGVGSVGATLITWILCGIYNLVLALCYAELGTAFPVAGGDYTYIQNTLGSAPAFMCLYIYVFMGPVAAAVSSRIVGEYIFPVMGLGCHYYVTVILAVFLNLSFAAINSMTVKGTARFLVVFTVIKLVAFGVIIVIGLVKLGEGYVDNFTGIFEGTILNPGSIALGIIPGFVSYSGWDMVCSLAGEMKNPTRDLPLSLIISLLSVTGIYVMLNVSYFTVLTPKEFIASSAVGVSFAQATIPNAAWVLPIFVSLSALGSLHSEYLGMPRYTYAGAKDKQLPEILSFLSIHYYTPLPAIGLQLLLSIFFTSATFFDIQGLFLILGVNIQLKIGLALIGLLVIKYKMPHLERSLKVPTLVVIICLIIITAITGLAVYADPITNGVGCLIFLLGLPLFYMGQGVKRSSSLMAISDVTTAALQKLLLVVPTQGEDEE